MRRTLETDAQFVDYVAALGARGVLAIPPHERVSVENISGNINRVRRVRFEGATPASFIVKLVPPGGALEKYPQISFPEDRLRFEAFYLEAAARAGDGSWTPRLLHDDAENEILVLEDLAPARSLEASVVSDAGPATEFYDALGEALGRFHAWSASLEIPEGFSSNPSAAANRPYVLTLPLEHPETMRSIWDSKGGAPELVELQRELLESHGERLLPMAHAMAARFREADPSVLTHGDLHGESVFVRPDLRPTVLDCELCDRGAAWFDAGMLLAHLVMLREATGADTSESRFLSAYLKALAPGRVERLVHETLAMAGFEIIRRVIGAANAPFVTALDRKRALLERATELVLAPGSTRICKETL